MPTIGSIGFVGFVELIGFIESLGLFTPEDFMPSNNNPYGHRRFRLPLSNQRGDNGLIVDDLPHIHPKIVYQKNYIIVFSCQNITSIGHRA